MLNKRSSIAGKMPKVFELEYGELAINYAEGKEFLSVLNSASAVTTFDNTTSYPKGDNGEGGTQINYDAVALKGAETAETSLVSGFHSAALGHELQTSNQGEVAVGQFNETDEGVLFSVGKGTDAANRANALTVKSDGTTSVDSLYINNGDDVTLVINGDEINLSDYIESVQVEIDDELSSSSTHPVQNKVIYEALDEIKGVIVDDELVTARALNDLNDRIDSIHVDIDIDSELSSSSTNPVENQAITKVIADNERAIAAALTGLDGRVSENAQNIANTYNKSQVDNMIDGVRVTVDNVLSTASTNPVQNAVITQALNSIEVGVDISQEAGNLIEEKSDGIYASNAGILQNAADIAELSGNVIDNEYVVSSALNDLKLDLDEQAALIDALEGSNHTHNNKNVLDSITAIDSTLSTASTNPVQNAAIASALNSKADASDLSDYLHKTGDTVGSIEVTTTGSTGTGGGGFKISTAQGQDKGFTVAVKTGSSEYAYTNIISASTDNNGNAIVTLGNSTGFNDNNRIELNGKVRNFVAGSGNKRVVEAEVGTTESSDSQEYAMVFDGDIAKAEYNTTSRKWDITDKFVTEGQFGSDFSIDATTGIISVTGGTTPVSEATTAGTGVVRIASSTADTGATYVVPSMDLLSTSYIKKGGDSTTGAYQFNGEFLIGSLENHNVRVSAVTTPSLTVFGATSFVFGHQYVDVVGGGTRVQGETMVIYANRYDAQEEPDTYVYGGLYKSKTRDQYGHLAMNAEDTVSYVTEEDYASTTKAGVIKVGSGLAIDSNGFLTASGGGGTTPYSPGDGISIANNTISVNPAGTGLTTNFVGKTQYATTAQTGVVKIGTGLSVANDGTISVTGAGQTYTNGEGLNLSNNTFSVKLHSDTVGSDTTTKGLGFENGELVPRIGSGLTYSSNIGGNEDNKIIVNLGDHLAYSSDYTKIDVKLSAIATSSTMTNAFASKSAFDTHTGDTNAHVTTAQTSAWDAKVGATDYATISKAGIVKVGTGLAVDSTGTISVTGGGGGGVTVDSTLSTSSTNPVQNAVITTELDNKADASALDNYLPITGGSVGKFELTVTGTAWNQNGVEITTPQQKPFVLYTDPSQAIYTISAYTDSNDVKHIGLNGAIEFKDPSYVTSDLNFGAPSSRYAKIGAQNGGDTKFFINGDIAKATYNDTTKTWSNEDKFITESKIGTGLSVGNDGTISVTGGGVTVDSALSTGSTNPVQNKVITAALDGYLPKTGSSATAFTMSTNDFVIKDGNNEDKIFLSGATQTGSNAYNLSIGTASKPITLVHIKGTLSADTISASTLYTENGTVSTSDRSLKDNIESICECDSEKLFNVDLKSFTMKDDKEGRKRYGVIAQDLEEAGLNELVYTNEESKLKAVDYTGLLILKVSQLEKEIEKLKKKLDKLDK